MTATGAARAASVQRTIPNRPGTSVRRVVVIGVACLIEAILVLGLTAASLGLGYEDWTSPGPGRPSPPVTTPR
jgi:hypothetical protein